MSDLKVRWEMMTPAELDEAIARLPLAIVPAGSIEWHGPHMTCGSDFIRGDAICTTVAERLGGGVVLPATWVAAPGFCNWRGTISFTPALVKQVALELYRELEKCGFEWIFVHLAHAGQMQREAWEGAARQYVDQGFAKILVKHGPDGPFEADQGGGHAGPNEAAELMASFASAVHLDRYDPEDTLLPKYPGCDPWLYSRGLSPAARESVFRFMAREHYEWDADLAQKVMPETARALFDEVCDKLTDELRAWIAETEAE